MVLFPLENRNVIIKAVVVSQEPAAQRRKLVVSDDVRAVERHLRNEGLGVVPPHPLLKQIQEIIGRPYDAYGDTIYWTHSLKCIPYDDTDIRKKKEWRRCSPSCIGHLRRELRAIPASELVIIALGAYATGLALATINNEEKWLVKPPKLNNFIEGLGSEAAQKNGLVEPRFKTTYEWEGKKFYLTSFIHKSNENRTMTEGSKKVKAEEIKFIREWLADS